VSTTYRNLVRLLSGDKASEGSNNSSDREGKHDATGKGESTRGGRCSGVSCDAR
jgi:hypothetical protein